MCTLMGVYTQTLVHIYFIYIFFNVTCFSSDSFGSSQTAVILLAQQNPPNLMFHKRFDFSLSWLSLWLFEFRETGREAFRTRTTF